MQSLENKEFIVIVFTAPEPVEGEAQIITRLLSTGAADFVHLRRPDATSEELRSLIEAIPADLHNRLRIHSHFELAAMYGLGGIHLNSRYPVAPIGSRHITASCHSLGEVPAAVSPYDYVTLSPIFDSISKPGYASAFSPEECSRVLKASRVVALGGVRPEHLGRLRNAGFYGAALLGAIWQAPDGPLAAVDRLADARRVLEIET